MTNDNIKDLQDLGSKFNFKINIANPKLNIEPIQETVKKTVIVNSENTIVFKVSAPLDIEKAIFSTIEKDGFAVMGLSVTDDKDYSYQENNLKEITLGDFKERTDDNDQRIYSKEVVVSYKVTKATNITANETAKLYPSIRFEEFLSDEDFVYTTQGVIPNFRLSHSNISNLSIYPNTEVNLDYQIDKSENRNFEILYSYTSTVSKSDSFDNIKLSLANNPTKKIREGEALTVSDTGKLNLSFENLPSGTYTFILKVRDPISKTVVDDPIPLIVTVNNYEIDVRFDFTNQLNTTADTNLKSYKNQLLKVDYTITANTFENSQSPPQFEFYFYSDSDAKMIIKQSPDSSLEHKPLSTQNPTNFSVSPSFLSLTEKGDYSGSFYLYTPIKKDNITLDLYVAVTNYKNIVKTTSYTLDCVDLPISLSIEKAISQKELLPNEVFQVNYTIDIENTDPLFQGLDYTFLYSGTAGVAIGDGSQESETKIYDATIGINELENIYRPQTSIDFKRVDNNGKPFFRAIGTIPFRFSEVDANGEINLYLYERTTESIIEATATIKLPISTLEYTVALSPYNDINNLLVDNYQAYRYDISSSDTRLDGRSFEVRYRQDNVTDRKYDNTFRIRNETDYVASRGTLDWESVETPLTSKRLPPSETAVLQIPIYKVNSEVLSLGTKKQGLLFVKSAKLGSLPEGIELVFKEAVTKKEVVATYQE